MRTLLTILFLINVLLSVGQNFVYPPVNKTGKYIGEFIPSGWKILDSISGDLNNDHHADAAVILQLVDSALIIEKDGDSEDSLVTQPRILIILFKNTSDNLFHLACQNNTFILNSNDPFIDDPYQSISIKRNILQINFHWYPNSGNWFHSNDYKFRYQNDNFYLIGATYKESNKMTHDFSKYDYNFLTDKRTSKNGNWDKKKEKSKTETFDNGTLQTIGTLKRPYSRGMGDGIIL